MRKLKSIISTLMISGGILGAMYFIPIQVEKKKKIELPIITEEEEMLGEEKEEEIIELPEVIDIPEIIIEETTIVEEKEDSQQGEELTSEIVKKEEEKQKEEDKKSKNNSKEEKKESKIGEDRKLVSGIPGTLNYKGKFPPHNVKEKGSITIAYTVDANGNVISAYRTDGLRSKNTINNAITLVKKYVKAEKAKTKSTGTYTIEFK